MSLIYATTISPRKVFDTITLVDGQLVYDTGAAEPLVAVLRHTAEREGRTLTDAQAYDELASYDSNGHVMVIDADLFAVGAPPA